MDTTKITIESTNLLLIPINLSYKKQIFREYTPEITKYMVAKSPTIIKETINFIKNGINENKNGKGFVAIITSKKTGEYLGNCGIHKIDTSYPSLGIWIKKSAHGNAYGKEAVTALKTWAEKNLDYEYIIYDVVALNHASRRIPESFGGKVFNHRDFVNGYGEKFEAVGYKINPPN